MNNISITLNISEDILTNIATKTNSTYKLEDYLLALINTDLKSKVLLKDNYYFDKNSNRIYNGTTEIILTKVEFILFNLLFDNYNTLVTYEDIIFTIWGLEEIFVSKFTLRNHIKRLRDKIYPSLIKSRSNQGYIMIIDQHII